MMNLQEVSREDLVWCPSLEVFFICDTDEKKECVRQFNERVIKEGWK